MTKGRKTLITTGPVATNRKAGFRYTILNTYEAGIILTGGEVKSLRAGHASIGESYAARQGNGLWLINATIMEYNPTKNGFVQHIAGRARQLLLHRAELNKILTALTQKGQTVVPLEIYFNSRGVAKVKIALAVGKTNHDKRETIKKRDWNREKRRILAHYNNHKS